MNSSLQTALLLAAALGAVAAHAAPDDAHTAVIIAEKGALPAVIRRAADVRCALLKRSALPDTVLVRCEEPAASAVKVLAGLPGVRSAEPELFRRVRVHGMPDPRRDEQWWLDVVRADGAWELTVGDPSVIVAVMDNGTDITHPDLAGQFVAGIDVIDGDANPEPGCTYIPDGRGEVSTCPDEAPYLESHGTAVCGIVGAVRGNPEGGSGLCPGCSLLAVRLLDGDDVMSSFRFADAMAQAIAAGASVINNSWGIDEWEYRPLTAVEEEAFALARSARDGLGVVVVFSSGNDGAQITREPYASHPDVISVGASSRIDDWVPYSNIGAALDLVAPSRDATNAPEDDGAIFTTDLRGGLGYSVGDYTPSFGGTSASAPMVSAAAGLLLSRFPALTAAQVRLVLVGSAEPITATHMPWVELVGRDVATEFAYDDAGHSVAFGFGRLDVEAALVFAETLSPLFGACTPACAACVEGQCWTACSADEPCPRGATCDVAVGLCEGPQRAALGGPCTEDCALCVPALFTNDEVTEICSVPCAPDMPCPDGYACRATDLPDAPAVCVPGELGEAVIGDAVTCFGGARSAVVTTLSSGLTICTDSCAAPGLGACPLGFACTPTACRCALLRGGFCFVEECGPSVEGPGVTTSAVCLPDAETGVTCAGGCLAGEFCAQDGDCRPDDRAGCDICAPCAEAATCGAGETCVAADGATSFCTRPCASDSDCPGDSVCKDVITSGVARQLCGSDDDTLLCAADAACASGCADDSTCAVGESCVSGRCAVPVPGVDAGPEPNPDEDDADRAPDAAGCPGCTASGGALPAALALLLLFVRGRRRPALQMRRMK